LETITHSWLSADGSVPNGAVKFSLSGSSEGPQGSQGTSISTEPVIGPLVAGVLSQPLEPNVDEHGAPNGSFYWCEEEVVGSTPASYPITVLPGGPTDLYSLRELS
jgi:hypothetical protein